MLTMILPMMRMILLAKNISRVIRSHIQTKMNHIMLQIKQINTVSSKMIRKKVMIMVTAMAQRVMVMVTVMVIKESKKNIVIVQIRFMMFLR